MEDEYLYNFLVYDENEKLLYSQFNFNFELYKSTNFISSENKNYLWKSFIIQNYILLLLNNKTYNSPFLTFETEYRTLIHKYMNEPEYIMMLQKINTLPYMLHDTMIRYFTNMTPTIETFISTYGFLHNVNVKNQFNVIPYPVNEMNDMNLIQIFSFIDSDNKTYNKYNFDFEKYSIYFKIFSNKLVIFTDFLLRNSYLILNENMELHPFFKSFFKTTNDGIEDTEYVSPDNYKNIDFLLFQLRNDIINEEVTVTKKKFITTYQFERKKISFYKEISKPNLIKESVANILTNSSTCYAGFLVDLAEFKNDGNFLITTTKILEDTNSSFSAIFENKIFKFNIIGYDILTGILVGHNIEKIHVERLKIKMTTKIKEFENIVIVNATNHIRGVVSNIHYIEEIKCAVLENGLLPEKILIDCHNYNNIIGSPIFVNDDNLNDSCCISMIVETIPNVISCQPYILYNVIDYIISEFKETSKISTFYPKAWLGIKSHYFNMTRDTYDNMPYIGGLVIDDFAVGYNNTTNEVIYSLDPPKQSCTTSDKIIKIDGILLNSKIHSHKLPIIIKSITMSNKKFYFGKYNKQESYTFFTYGLFPKMNQKINIEYLYLSETGWIEDTEYIGGDAKDSFVNTTSTGIYQHKLEYPAFLWNYKIPLQNINGPPPTVITDISLLLSETTLNNKEYSISLNISTPSFLSNKSSLSGPYNNFYLPEYAYYKNQHKFDTFSEAIVAAYALKCSGITYEPNCKKFTLRISNNLCYSTIGEISFLILSNNVKTEDCFMTKQQLLDKALETSALHSCSSLCINKRYKERNKIHTFFEELYKESNII